MRLASPARQACCQGSKRRQQAGRGQQPRSAGVGIGSAQTESALQQSAPRPRLLPAPTQLLQHALLLLRCAAAVQKTSSSTAGQWWLLPLWQQPQPQDRVTDTTFNATLPTSGSQPVQQREVHAAAAAAAVAPNEHLSQVARELAVNVLLSAGQLQVHVRVNRHQVACRQAAGGRGER